MQCDRETWTTWCQICLFIATTVIILSEKASVILCLVHFLFTGQTLWAGLTLGLILPSSVVQMVSFRWFRSDGEVGKIQVPIHVLHMGIFLRLWRSARASWQQKSQADPGWAALVWKQVDMSALVALEGLLLGLPQTLLFTYILFTSEEGLLSPVALSCGLCLLSLSWSLVLLTRACSLLRPGHVPMPPAALVCQLVWRASMLGARLVTLVYFSRVFSHWLWGVLGLHWLLASFWLASLQTDICRSPWLWRLFNCIMGALHIFFFLNLKDGPSRFRMAAFYVVMLLENFGLLLSASDILAEASWASLCIPTAVLCSFLIGIVSVTLYYRFLHPKSTEILQSLHRSHTTQGSLGHSSVGEKSVPEPSVHRHGTFSITCNGQTLGLSDQSEVSMEKPSDLPSHHHWLLICLAMKTGDWSKVNLAYGPEGLAALLEVPSGPKCTADEPDVESAPRSVIDEQPSMKKDSAHNSFSTSVYQSPFPEEARETGENDREKSDASVGTGSDPPNTGTKRGCPEGRSFLGESLEMDVDVDDSDTSLYFSADPNTPGCASGAPAVVRDTDLEAMAQLSPVANRQPPPQGTQEFLRSEPCYTSTPKHDPKPKELKGLRPALLRKQVLFK